VNGCSGVPDNCYTGESKLGLADGRITQEKMNDNKKVFPGMIEEG
jgi:hypothetical protein